jgi:hypothetical protein
MLKVNDGELLVVLSLTLRLIIKGDDYFDFTVNGELPKNELLKMPIDLREEKS